MNPTQLNAATPNLSPINLQQALGDFEEIKEHALTSLQKSFRVLAKMPGKVAGSEAPARTDGLPNLEAPSASKNVNDLTLRIGLLQDALNQLMAQVSKTEIRQRMSELQKENQRQLEKFEKQMAEAAKAAEKAKEAQKKGNVFEAIGNWIQAAVAVVSAVITMVSAVGQILTNPVGAAGLIVASVALIGVAAVQITMAIDATMRAAGEEGFLSDTDRQKMQKAAEIMGYIAIAGAMIGLVGGLVVALGQAGRAAGQIAGQEVGKLAASKMVAVGMKEGLRHSMNMSIERVAMYAFQESMKPMLQFAARMALVQLVGQGASAINTGVGKEKVADLKQQASESQAEADKAEAAAKALQAQIAKLRALIEQLQQELEHMLDQGQQTLAVIFGSIDESAESMTRIHQSTSA